MWLPAKVVFRQKIPKKREKKVRENMLFSWRIELRIRLLLTNIGDRTWQLFWSDASQFNIFCSPAPNNEAVFRTTCLIVVCRTAQTPPDLSTRKRISSLWFEWSHQNPSFTAVERCRFGSEAPFWVHQYSGGSARCTVVLARHPQF